MLENTAVISVDQDGVAAERIVDSGNGQAFSKRESNGDYVIALYNTSATATTTVSVPLSAAGISGSVTATNLWTGASTGTISGTYSVTLGPGAVQLIRTNGGTATAGEEVHAVGASACLDVPQPTSPPAPEGTQLDIWTCNGGGNQLWTHTSGNQLTVYSGAECLDAAGNGTAPGTKVQIWPCNGGTNQQWDVNSNGTITGVQSGLCLDVTGASASNGALIDLWTCSGGSNQQWTLG